MYIFSNNSILNIRFIVLSILFIFYKFTGLLQDQRLVGYHKKTNNIFRSILTLLSMLKRLRSLDSVALLSPCVKAP